MQNMFIISSIVLSMMFMQTKHPLAMGSILLIQTTIMCIISGLMMQTFWFSYVLFLIFLGGMLVLFIYVTSLASNEMFNMSMKMITMMTVMIIPLTMLTINLPQNNIDLMSQILMSENEITTLLTKLYNKPNNMITILLASYLFLSLIVVAKITNISKGPLRSMN
uniref:NADH dehydrogenase subunit 6 n=1 Tax=Eupolyphaga nigrinotum TaxID=2972403 RepID=UPI002E777718|nr:NADH dehydrogenase subunit 6 [Eupolyphaga nigrinotum]WPM91826.1 NADH dehydrogenase subunit 6 [Eupolyphaga nigrinotum]